MTQPAEETVPAPAPALPTLEDVITANAQDMILMTDRGNGRRFTEMYRHMVRYVVNQDRWIVRQGQHWRVDDSRLLVLALTAGVIRRIRDEAVTRDDDGNLTTNDDVANFATRTEAEPARWRMISSAREHPELIVREDDLDHDLNLIATPDGVVDLLTGEQRPTAEDGSDLCTMQTTVSYDPDAASPLLDEYLSTFIPDPDDQQVLWAILGTILRGGNPGRIFPVFIGGTTSGKSQLIAALDKLLGDYICTINVSVFRGNLDDKPRPDLVRAMNRRIAYAVEASKTWELHADQVKRITGGDAVPYRDLYAQSVEKIPRFTPLIITNTMPRVKGADQAMRRRMITFTFDKTLPPEKEDARIKERFINDEQCLRAILARVVAGARDPMMRNGIKWSLMPAKYAEATMDSFGQLDHIEEFIEYLRDREILQVVNMSETPVSHCAKASDLHEFYVKWVQRHGDKQDKLEQLNLKDFGQALRDRGWEAKTSGGTRWLGVKLTQSPSVFGL